MSGEFLTLTLTLTDGRLDLVEDVFTQPAERGEDEALALLEPCLPLLGLVGLQLDLGGDLPRVRVRVRVRVGVGASGGGGRRGLCSGSGSAPSEADLCAEVLERRRRVEGRE